MFLDYFHYLFDLRIYNKEMFVNIVIYFRYSFSRLVIRGCQHTLSTSDIKEIVIM